MTDDVTPSGWPDQARRPLQRALGWVVGIAGAAAAVAVARQVDDPTVPAAALTAAAVLAASLIGGPLAGMGSAATAGLLAWRWLTPDHPAAEGFELFLAAFGLLIALGVGATLQLRYFARLRSEWLERLRQLTEDLDAALEADDPLPLVEAAAGRAAGAHRACLRTIRTGGQEPAGAGARVVISRISPSVELELDLAVEPPDALAVDHATFLGSVADQCAQTLQRAELERAEQRASAAFALLARASSVLSASLDVREVLATVEALVVPDLADECVVRIRPRISQPGGHRTERTAAMSAEGASTIPLRAHGELIAELDLRRRDRRLAEDELEAAVVLAEPVGRALDHALLYAEQVQTSSRLEHSLLPPALLPIEHLDVATRYLAAAEGHAAGGDFYDVLRVPSGSAVLVVGDVQGKGIEAATLTSAARHTLRAAALDGAGPAEMLARLNEALLYGAAERAVADPREPTVRFVTVAVVALEPTPTGFRAVVASGGHPPPLLIPARGAPQQLVVDGVILGVFADARFAEARLDLALADVVVLYSDGVTEQRAQPDLFDEAQLGRLVRNMHTGRHVDADAAAQLILDTVIGLNPREVRDDIALVVARVTGPR